MKIREKTIAVVIAVVFIISLLPCLFISIYNHPSYDDYSFGTIPRLTRIAGGSLGDILFAAAQQVSVSYGEWQGTFTGIFLMALMPNIWGDGFYPLGGLVVYFMFILSTLYTVRRVGAALHAGKLAVAIISLIMLGLSIHLLPSPVEGFYWYNSAMYYTGFYSMLLFLIGFALKTTGLSNEGNVRRVPRYVFMAVLSFFIGGGNFVTALVGIEVLSCISFWLLSNRAYRMDGVAVLLATIAMVSALAISALAPGNAVRATYFDGWPFFQAILQSFKNGAIYLFDYTTTPVVLALVAFTLPFLAQIAKHCNLSFKYPLAALVFGFCLFCSQYAPTLYGTGGMGGGRVQNIRFFAYIWFMLMICTYMLGWLQRRKTGEWLLGMLSKSNRWCAVMAILSIIAIPLSSPGRITGLSSMRSIVDGSAIVYHDVQVERERLLLADGIDVVVPALKSKPLVLFMFDISPNSEENRGIASFYGKASVCLVD